MKKLSFNPTFSYTDYQHSEIAKTATTSKFLACAGDSIELWDIHYLTHNQSSYQPDYQVPLQTCQWSLLSPQLFVTGGDAGHLHGSEHQ